MTEQRPSDWAMRAAKQFFKVFDGPNSRHLSEVTFAVDDDLQVGGDLWHRKTAHKAQRYLANIIEREAPPCPMCAELAEALREVPPERLRMLADWFDATNPWDDDPEVQSDLRAMARKSQAALAKFGDCDE